ncbi:putative membrane protein [Gaiella occulta]|uniref:Putative membrane protein n=1 Tax=Gaiella occulta TaxID=1002870 RepID=A0A7M2Z0R2_9ACTN|nr:putative sulfate exporter family transporter [Gaiella occulta]RDI75871.1 putative membrane protein [Gaiella occulta]
MSVPKVFPGIMLVAGLSAAAYTLMLLVPTTSSLIWALLLGAVTVNLIGPRPRLHPGIAFAAKPLLRLGVALLGIRMSVSLFLSIGWRGLLIVPVSLAATLLLTVALGKRLGLPPALALLIGTGSSICGASAIAAMESVSDAKEEETAFAVATVTLFGSAAMLGLPLVGENLLGLSPSVYGVWAGASVHEVAQVVGATAGVSAVALKVGTVVKLARVTLLAPSVAVVGSLRNRQAASTGAGRALPVPTFVLAFLGLVALRSTGWVPDVVVRGTTTLDTLLLTAALAGLGLGVDVRRLRRLGLRPIVLGFASWLLIAGISLVLILALY